MVYPLLKEDKQPMWKGEQAGYVAKHKHARRYYLKPSCEDCGTISKLQMANISGKYLRTATDWRTLCARCHCKFDKRPQAIRLNFPIGKSGFRGVYRHEKGGWYSRITIDKLSLHLGHFKDLESAIMIRVAAEQQLLKEET